ncbi:MAG: hypothetical protein WBG41_00895 [Acidimicrobiales bacterium]
MSGRRGPIIAVLAAASACVSAAALLGAAAVVASSPADAAVVTNRQAIVQPGTLTPLRGGGSATPYGIALPAGASCPGDTAHDQYRVYSYLIPAGVALSSVSYKGDLPHRYYGFIAYGAYFGAVNTAEGTGQIIGIPPAFTFSRLTPSELFNGGTTSSATWEGGIACVNPHGVATDAWNTQFRFVRDAKDPGGFRWTAEDAGSVSSGGGNSWLWIGAGLIALSVLSAVILLLLLQRRGARGTDPRGGEGRDGGGGADGDGDGVAPSGGPSTDAERPETDDHDSLDTATEPSDGHASGPAPVSTSRR